MPEETLLSLAWPKREIQAEWGLLARCLTDPACVHLQTPEDQGRSPELAGLHGVGPLLYHRLKMIEGLDGLPDHVVSRLRQMYLRAAASNLILHVQLSPLGRAFGEAGLPFLLVKGVILASLVYPDPALRPLSDIDVIVRPEDENTATQVIEKLGYIPDGVEAFGLFSQKVTHGRAYRRPGQRGLPLDLHNVLTNELRGSLKTGETWFWQHTLSIPVNGQTVLILSPEVNLMHLSVHLVGQHGWAPRFIWVHDLHALLERYQETFDWEQFTYLAHKMNCDIYCECALRAARTYLQSAVPEKVLINLSQGSRKSLVQKWKIQSPSSRMLRTLGDWQSIPDPWSRLRFLWHTLFPGRTYMLHRYQPRSHYIWLFLYPYRWGLMLRDLKRTAELWWHRSTC